MGSEYDRQKDIEAEGQRAMGTIDRSRMPQTFPVEQVYPPGSPEMIEEAKKLLEANGYRVAATPALWRDFGCVVSIPIMAHGFTETDWTKVVERIIHEALPSIERIKKLSHRDIVQMGKIEVKMLSRVIAAVKRGAIDDALIR